MQERDEEHFIGLVAQKALIEKQGKVFFVKNINDDRWDFPGGRLNINELPEEGIKRELKEELGCEVEINSVIYVNQYFHSAAKKPCLFINYAVSLMGRGDLKLAQDELSEFAWLDPHEVTPEKTFPNCTHSLEEYFNKI